MTEESIIKTENVTVSFGDFQALKGIDAEIKQGEIIVILGPSGSGKSTFIRTLNQLQPHDGGRIEVDGGKEMKLMQLWTLYGPSQEL